jgi:VanZ family protein
MSPAVTRTLRRSAAPVALMASIFFFSSQADLNSGLGTWDLIGRKLIHMASFGGLTWLWFWALRGTVPRPMLSAAVIAFLYACSDEYHQHFVHGRHGTPVDVLIDSVGIGVVVWWEERRRGG